MSNTTIEPKPSLNNGNANGFANGNGFNNNNGYAGSNGYNGNNLHMVDTGAHSQDYQGTGGPVRRFLTPGGNPIDNTQPAFPIYHRKFGNPAPLGLLAFGATTFILSMYNVQARGIQHPNVVLGMALAYGGFAQMIAGVQEWAVGNTFGATAFTSYGGFWVAYACLFIPQFEVRAAYSTQAEFASAVTIFLAAWFIVTFIFLVASLRSSIALAGVFFFLDITFLLLMIGDAMGKVVITKAGGGFGLVTAALAGYVALAGLLTKDTSYFLLPVGDLSRKKNV